ncbi:ABC transporter permease [Lichenihabitans psoromatis]|uniref:ABC transporter permease n=1 Tax=Lichenihabitans psoromatis TaxID=2528642 RepID=UPI0010385B43|nr:ABC transporter permease [Lichenihabitans psoromatis]
MTSSATTTPLRSTALAAAGLLVFLCVWEAAPRLGLVNPLFLPPPSTIPVVFWREIASGVWPVAVLSSLTHYVVGLLIGASAGIAFGLAAGMLPRVEHLTAWVVRLLRPIPGLAWVPFAIIWFGVEPSAAVFIIAIGVFWIVFFATLGAVRAVDRDLVEVAQAFGFRTLPSLLVKVILPAATPGILVGLRTALGQAWMSVVASEIFGVPGVGQRMMQASSLLATDIVIVYMLTMAGLYGLFDSAFVALQGWVLRWRP